MTCLLLACLSCFFSGRFLCVQALTNIILCLMGWLQRIWLYGIGSVCWLDQPGMVKYDQKISHKWNLFFKAVPLNKLPCLPCHLLHVISSLLIQVSLVPRVLKFKAIFFRMYFLLIALFFSLDVVICLSWELHLKLFHEVDTFISFTIWRSTGAELMNKFSIAICINCVGKMLIGGHFCSIMELLLNYYLGYWDILSLWKLLFFFWKKVQYSQHTCYMLTSKWPDVPNATDRIGGDLNVSMNQSHQSTLQRVTKPKLLVHNIQRSYGINMQLIEELGCS